MAIESVSKIGYKYRTTSSTTAKDRDLLLMLFTIFLTYNLHETKTY